MSTTRGSRPVTLPARVLVTGGAGFIGAGLVGRLVDLGCDVHVVVRHATGLGRIAGLAGRITLHHADLAEAGDVNGVVRAVEPDTVFHVAATGGYGNSSETTLFRDNVLSTFNLLDATASRPACRVIHTASSLEPGPRSSLIAEDAPAAPTTSYAMAKAAATLLAKQAAVAGRRVVILRPFAVYGPGEPDRRLIPTAIRAARTGTPLSTTGPGYTRDLVFLDDVVDAYVAAATTPGIDGELINVATGRATDNEQVIRLVERLVGRDIVRAPVAYPAKAMDRPFWCADVAKARRLLGWQATHDVEQGLARTVARHDQPSD